MDKLVSSARRLVEGELAGVLPRRWAHVSAVAAKAELVACAVDERDRPALVASAWLHDIGYAPDIVATGFHPLDGARWLRSQGFEPRIAALVAHHSCALIEADERGLAGELRAEFPQERSATADALCYCDMTTGPDGRDCNVVDRLHEIRCRYAPGDVVARFVERARGQLVDAVRRTESRLSMACGHPM